MGEKNYGKSVRAKLLNISKAEKLGYQLIVIRYIQERLLYRLSQSRFREKLFLKGGALLYALEQFRARPTLDIDFLGDKISRDKEFVKMAFEEICAVSCPEDGMTFDTESISAEEITVNKEYHGIRLHVTARLDTIRQVISMDIGFGDVITPKPEELDYPVLLKETPAVNIMAYSLETVVAEKFQAMIDLAEENSRMKDFFDVYRILESNKVNEEMLQQAITATFSNRETGYKPDHILFAEEFVKSPTRIAFWKGFLRKIKYTEELSFETVMTVIKERLQGYWEKFIIRNNMDNKKLSEKKQELMKPDWTENLHHELQELPLQEAKWIVENMTDSEIFSKVNNRRFQEDYIADYIEYLWTISPIAYWKHIIASLSPNIGALWSDNMSHFRKMCTIKIPVDVLHAVLSFAISHDDKNRQDSEAIGCVIKAQIDKFGRIDEIKAYISSLPENQRVFAKEKIFEYVKQECGYIFY